MAAKSATNEDRSIRRNPEKCQSGAALQISSHTFICEGVEIEDNVSSATA